MLTEPPVNIFISEVCDFHYVVINQKGFAFQADPQKLSIFMASLQQVADRNVLDKKLSLNLWEENSRLLLICFWKRLTHLRYDQTWITLGKCVSNFYK